MDKICQSMLSMSPSNMSDLEFKTKVAHKLETMQINNKMDQLENEFKDMSMKNEDFEKKREEVNKLSMKRKLATGENFILPVVQNVCPWSLEKQGITFTEWCLHKNNVYVGHKLKRLLGPTYKLLSEDVKCFECRYTGPTRITRYGKYVKNKLWHQLWKLSGKNLGCYCFENENCHCKHLVLLCKKKFKVK